MLPVLALCSCAAQAVETDLSDGFELPAGLAVTLWAESPDLYNPAAIDVDERGRVWVAEAVNYRTWDGRNPGRRHPNGERIVVLEDVGGDGACDRSSVFVEDQDLVAPLGIAVIAGKVYVSCSPSLYVYEDTDGDGDADKRETLLTGFGGHDHDHGLHSVVAAPDGKLYFAVGNAGPHVVTDASGWTLRSGSVYRDGGAAEADNKPGLVSDDGRVWVGGLICRVGYDGKGLEVLAHNFRNQYEVALDSYGGMYTADNDDDGNGGCRTTWVMPGGNYGFFSADGSRTWQADRRPGQDNWTAHWHQDDPGVMPAGTRNGPGAPGGCMVYEGELLARWVGGAVVNTDSGARVVYAHFPGRRGGGGELLKRDLLRPKAESEEREARWFRPSDVCAGTDGALYVADWWDPVVGGHAQGDPEARGRILRIAPAGSAPRAPRYDLATLDGQLEVLASTAVNVRELGRRALATRGKERVEDLKKVLLRHRDTPFGMRLAQVVGLGPLPRTLDMLLGRRGHPLAELLPSTLELAGELDGRDRVLLEAFGLAVEGFEEEVYALLVDELDGWDPLSWDERFESLAWRLHPPSATPAFRARALAPELPIEARRRALDALAFTPTREAADAMLAASEIGPEDLRPYARWWVEHRSTNDWRAFGLAERVARPKLAGAELLWTSEVLSSGLVDVDVDVSGAETLWLVVLDGGDGNGCDWADWIAPSLVGGGKEWKLAETPWLVADAQWGSVQAGRNCEEGPLRAGGVQTEDGIGTHALSRIAFAVPEGAERFRAQAGPDEAGVAQGCGTSLVFQVFVSRPAAPPPTAEWEARLLADEAELPARRAAAEALARDPQGALRLIRLDEEGALPDALRDTVCAAIHANPDLGVRALASARFPRPGQAADFPSIPALVALQGDARRGRALYQDRERAQCLACHAFTLGETTLGGDVGPELTAIRDKVDAAALFDAILNPSAAIAHGYDAWLFETTGGQLYTGFLLADGPSVVLKDTRGERHVFDAEEIAARTKQTLSTMPAGVALGLAPQELADLVAFLRADPAAEPVLGEEVALFDGTSLDAWTCHLPEGAALADVWSIHDGVLACRGQPIGYLRTKERFESFHLSLEWRFDPAKGAGNSGVLLRVVGEDKVWPRSIEAQLHSENAGDIWNIDEVGLQVDPARTDGRRTARAQPCSEKPLGEWNRYDILLDGPRLELRVNGVLQNTADWCEQMPGWIALQSEGAAIEFRDVRLRPIPR